MLNRKNKRNLAVIFTFILTGAVLVAFFCFGQTVSAQSTDAVMANATDLTLPGIGLRVGVGETIIKIINYLLGFLGLVAVILIMYAGYVWMTAGGDDEKVGKAKKIIINAVIGLAVVLLSFIIVRVVTSAITNWVENQPGSNENHDPTPYNPPYLPDLPPDVSDPNKFKVNDIQTSHGGSQKNENVRLCSTVQTIFNNGVKTDSLNNEINSSGLKITKVSAGVETKFSDDGRWYNSGRVTQYKPGTNKFVANSTYKLYLPKTLEDRANNFLSECAAEGCQNIGNNFVWQFRTGTETDEVAPTVASVYPSANATAVELSPTVTINFSEEIDGMAVNANNIKVFDASGRQLTNLTDFFVTGTRVSFGFSEDLTSYQRYKIRITNIADLCGNAMNPATYEWTFETGNERSAFSSYRPTGDKVCPNAKISFSFNTSLGLNRILLEVKKGSEAKRIILPAPIASGNLSVEVSGIGKLTALNDSYRSYEFVPANLFIVGSEYQVTVVTDKKISVSEILKTNWSFRTETPENCVAEDDENGNRNLAVVNDSRCVISGGAVSASPSPSPTTGRTDVCLKIAPSIRFNRQLDTATIGSDRFKIFECASDQESGCTTEVGGAVSSFIYSDASGGLRFTPTQNLKINKFYLAKVKAGLKGIDGAELKTDYSWKFKTMATDQVCAVESVDVEPNVYTSREPSESVPYHAAAFATGCQELTGVTNWSWNSSDINVATVTARGNGSAEATALMTTARRIGRTNISATLNNKTDSGILNYNPSADAVSHIVGIESKNPVAGATNVCTNATVQVVFDQVMNTGTLNGTNLKLYAASATNEAGCLTEVAKKESGWKQLIAKVWRQIFRKAEAVDYWCPVAGRVSFYSVGSGTKTAAEIAPTALLTDGTVFKVVVIGGDDGVKGAQGAKLPTTVSWQFTTQSGVCKISSAKVQPGRYLFHQKNENLIFQVVAYGKNRNGQENVIQSNSQYPFGWTWSKVDEANIINISAGADETEQKVTANDANGVATIYAKAQTAATVPSNLQSQATGSATITNFLCLAEDTVEVLADTNESHYLTMYCRRSGSDVLPGAIQNNTDSVNLSGSLAEKFVLMAEKDDNNTMVPIGDAIGIRVYSNPEKLSPKKWYETHTPNATEGAVSLKVAGYEAVKVGRTVYAAAANVFGDTVYNNIYLISYNNNAAAATGKVFEQLINNWQFNENLDVVERGQLVRDIKRFSDLDILKQALANYKDTNGFYPKLAAGSYKIGQTVSVWPSWSAEFGSALGMALPIDPLNNLKTPCVSGNDNSNYDTATCWNDTAKVFACPLGSHVYKYQTDSGTNFKIYVNMEYRAWSNNDSCEDYFITN